MTADPTLPVLVFDVNETLVDLHHLRPLFQRLFGDRAQLEPWFSSVILYAQALTLAGRYLPFGQVATSVLRSLGDSRSVPVSVEDEAELRTRLRTMPAHPDAAAALQRLQQAGFRQVTLTNSAPHPAGGPLQHSGLDRLFEQSFSVQSVQRFKPAPECYRSVATALGLPVTQLCLVAAHPWDTLGALCAGCSAALILRPGHGDFTAEGLPHPDVVGSSLLDVADRLIARYCGA